MAVRYDLIDLLVLKLTEVGDSRFAFGEWTGDSVYAPEHLEHNCETVACMGGWATTIKEFRDEGLQLINGVPMTVGFPPYSALANVLGISIKDSIYVFTPNHIHGVYEELPRSPQRDCTVQEAVEHLLGFAEFTKTDAYRVAEAREA